MCSGSLLTALASESHVQPPAHSSCSETNSGIWADCPLGLGDPGSSSHCNLMNNPAPPSCLHLRGTVSLDQPPPLPLIALNFNRLRLSGN